MSKNMRFKTGILLGMIISVTGILIGCGDQDHKAYDAAKILQSGEYYYEGIFYDGSDLDGYQIQMAAQGDEFAIWFRDEQEEPLAGTIGLKGKGYFLDPETKEYERDTFYDDVSYAYKNLRFQAEGQEMVPLLKGVNDQSLAYEEYEAQNGTETWTITFYFLEDKLYCIQEDFMDEAGEVISEVVVINQISGEIPKDFIQIPDGYQRSND